MGSGTHFFDCKTQLKNVEISGLDKNGCSRAKLHDNLKANHNICCVSKFSADSCSRAKLHDNLKANHNCNCIDTIRPAVVQELSYMII
jgi:hypothetical protein